MGRGGRATGRQSGWASREGVPRSSETFLSVSHASYEKGRGGGRTWRREAKPMLHYEYDSGSMLLLSWASVTGGGRGGGG